MFWIQNKFPEEHFESSLTLKNKQNIYVQCPTHNVDKKMDIATMN